MHGLYPPPEPPALIWYPQRLVQRHRHPYLTPQPVVLDDSRKLNVRRNHLHALRRIGTVSRTTTVSRITASIGPATSTSCRAAASRCLIFTPSRLIFSGTPACSPLCIRPPATAARSHPRPSSSNRLVCALYPTATLLYCSVAVAFLLEIAVALPQNCNSPTEQQHGEAQIQGTLTHGRPIRRG